MTSIGQYVNLNPATPATPGGDPVGGANPGTPAPGTGIGPAPTGSVTNVLQDPGNAPVVGQPVLNGGTPQTGGGALGGGAPPPGTATGQPGVAKPTDPGAVLGQQNGKPTPGTGNVPTGGNVTPGDNLTGGGTGNVAVQPGAAKPFVSGMPITGTTQDVYMSSLVSSIAQNNFMTSLAVMHLADAHFLQASLNYAVRRDDSSRGHYHRPTHQQSTSQNLTETFAQLNRQNMLVFTRSPSNAYGPAGPTALLNDTDNATLTRMVAASMREHSMSSANASMGYGTSANSGSGLQPQSVLTAYGLMHADRLGPDWLAMGISEVVRLAQGAGPQEADTILEALATALMFSALGSLRAQPGSNRELALAQAFAAMQLTAQMKDSDAFLQVFSKLGSSRDRTAMLNLLSNLNPQAKLSGLDTLDSMAMLLKSLAGRSAAQQGGMLEGLNRQSMGLAGTVGGRADTHTTEQLRAEMLQFVAMQPKSFYMSETPDTKKFHSQRMEAVLQLIVQQLLSELAAKAGRLARLRSDFADSIELLSNLLDLLSRRDSEHSHGDDEAQQEQDGENDGASDDEKAEAPQKDQEAPLRYDAFTAAQMRRSIEAEYYCQYLFRVVPDAERTNKVNFRWENFQANPMAQLPRQLDHASPVYSELKSLGEHARAAAITSSDVAMNTPRAVLAELLMPGDPAYALGAAAAGTTIMARHWHCKMWAHDLTYRLNFGQPNQPFDFSKWARAESSADALPRAEPAMRLDLLRMLENSQDRWVREQAASALATGMHKLSLNGGSEHEARGETVRALRTPMLRDATIYFLSRYYFKLKAGEESEKQQNAAPQAVNRRH
jgi:hypothetical protein